MSLNLNLLICKMWVIIITKVGKYIKRLFELNYLAQRIAVRIDRICAQQAVNKASRVILTGRYNGLSSQHIPMTSH